MRKNDVLLFLLASGACDGAVDWLKDKKGTVKSIYENCTTHLDHRFEREWLFWLYNEIELGFTDEDGRHIKHPWNVVRPVLIKAMDALEYTWYFDGRHNCPTEYLIDALDQTTSNYLCLHCIDYFVADTLHEFSIWCAEQNTKELADPADRERATAALAIKKKWLGADPRMNADHGSLITAQKMALDLVAGSACCGVGWEAAEFTARAARVEGMSRAVQNKKLTKMVLALPKFAPFSGKIYPAESYIEESTCERKSNDVP